MKKTTLIVTFALGVVAPLFADGTNVLTDEKSRVSYAFGIMTGHQWKQNELDFDPDLFVRGIKDAMSGGPTLITTNQAQQTIDAFRKELAAKDQQKMIELAAKNKTEGDAFLAKNKTQPGVVTLPDGLQYKVITQGDGAMPGDGDVVSVNVRGTLIDGTEWDNTAQTGKPRQFTIGQVFHGLSEALKLMKTGSKWQLFIPTGLAFGEKGLSSPRIPPNATLIIEVELLSVQHPSPQPAFAPPAASPPLTSDIIKVPSAEEMKKGAKIETIKAEDAQKLQRSQTNAAK
ncbi:MAG: FKBP-type peptidyl-prolyl cis-trans isomerase [Verrucomicrobiota bacterium]|jgi:FKBP-type peptidyl-prolyl cis-trans isomerase